MLHEKFKISSNHSGMYQRYRTKSLKTSGENLSNHLVVKNQSDLNCFKLPVVTFNTFRLILLCHPGDITGRRQSSLANLLREGFFNKKANGWELRLEQLFNLMFMCQQLELWNFQLVISSMKSGTKEEPSLKVIFMAMSGPKIQFI